MSMSISISLSLMQMVDTYNCSDGILLMHMFMDAGNNAVFCNAMQCNAMVSMDSLTRQRECVPLHLQLRGKASTGRHKQYRERKSCDRQAGRQWV